MVSAESQHAMDAAKQAVAEFMKRDGHHDTTVHERVMPAVTHHTIVRTEYEEVDVARDIEQHTSHYHTTIQPIVDEETLDTQHRAHVLPVDFKVFEHEDREEVRRRVTDEAAKFRDEVVHEDGEHTSVQISTLEGQHHHHHIHEVIQPILNKHTVEPWIVHTARFTHETHHIPARFHATTLLPTLTLAEFKKQGGILTGREERYDFFQGEPKSMSGVLGDSEKNPLPAELRHVGQEDRQAHDHEHSQMPAVTRTPTGQGNLNRTPTGQGNLTHTPTNLTHRDTGFPQQQQAPAPAQQQPQTSAPHSHLDPTAALHPAQHSGTPSTGHFGLMPLRIGAGDAVRMPNAMRTQSRTPQPTTALSSVGPSVGSAISSVGQRVVAASTGQPQGSEQQAQQQPGQQQPKQSQQPGSGQQGQQQQQSGQQQPKQSQQPGSGR